jgi:DNA-binding beta-propeller fold protein YncE
MFRHLFVLNFDSQKLLKIDLSTRQVSTVVNGLDSYPDGIEIDPARTHIYWTNMGAPALVRTDRGTDEDNLDFYARTGSIERVNFDGTGRTLIVAPGHFVTGKQLAGAWSSGRLYWADREGAAIRSVALDGSDQREEITVALTETDRRDARNHCVGVAVDESNGYLYWTQKGPAKGGVGQILRTSLELPEGQTASAREVEVLWSQLPEPIDLSLDLDEGVIYWTDRGAGPYGNTLNKAAIPGPGEAGGTPTVLASGFHEAIGLAVDKQGGVAYVGDLSGEIRVVSLDGSGDYVFEKTGGSITGIAGT